MIKGVVMIMLATETFSDIKTHSVSGIRIIAYGILGIVLNLVLYYQSVWSIIGGVAVGAVILGYAAVTKGAIGIGDGLIFLCLGIYLGLSDNLRLLFFSLLAAAVIGGIYVLVRKRSIKTQIPFMPYVLGAYMIMTAGEVLLRN